MKVKASGYITETGVPSGGRQTTSPDWVRNGTQSLDWPGRAKGSRYLQFSPRRKLERAGLKAPLICLFSASAREEVLEQPTGSFFRAEGRRVRRRRCLQSAERNGGGGGGLLVGQAVGS